MRDKIKLVSSAGTGHFYTTDKNKRTMPEKMMHGACHIAKDGNSRTGTVLRRNRINGFRGQYGIRRIKRLHRRREGLFTPGVPVDTTG